MEVNRMEYGCKTEEEIWEPEGVRERRKRVF